MSCELLLQDHQDAGDTDCPDAGHRKALAARQDARSGRWNPIVRGRDAGGDRDFLEGKPIHCGSTLELQVTECRDDDYGSFTAWLQTGVPVRYELDRGRVVIYAQVAGIAFTHAHETWMRFRWPAERRAS